jgi:hypothetical protein
MKDRATEDKEGRGEEHDAIDGEVAARAWATIGVGLEEGARRGGMRWSREPFLKNCSTHTHSILFLLSSLTF